MTENSPYLEDSYPCVECGQKAQYQCPNCGNLKFCNKHALKKAGKSLLYCPRCLYRLYEIPKRFVGSTKPLRKWRGTTHGMKPVYESPKIYPKSDRKKILRGENKE